MKNIVVKNQDGQALVTLLFFVTISIMVITSMAFIMYNNITAGANIEQGTVAYYAAETGAENALIRLLRDPSYTGENMNIDDVDVEINVTGGNIISTATYENSVKKIQVETVYNNNVLGITSWKEIK
jgi:hypothetical protein